MGCAHLLKSGVGHVRSAAVSGCSPSQVSLIPCRHHQSLCISRSVSSAAKVTGSGREGEGKDLGGGGGLGAGSTAINAMPLAAVRQACIGKKGSLAARQGK